MLSNLERYKKDLETLIYKGRYLLLALNYKCFPEEFKKLGEDEQQELLGLLPEFGEEYQIWYSEAKVVIKQLLPDRLPDFVRHYETPKSRKDIRHSNYCIEDYLQGTAIDIVGVDLKSAVPRFQQQLAILKSVSSRFESTLFDIRQLVQADLFDSELHAAREIMRYGFLRSAGVVAGVVLEKHLSQVSDNHNIKMRKTNPTISDFNEILKSNSIIDIPSWRKIQRLGDIRNLCGHHKDREPTQDEVEELVDGVEKFTKTLF